MAIIKRGVLGGFSGKIGNIVGTSWKGRAVMKSMPLSVANPRTSGQVNQRNSMTFAVAAAKEFLAGAIADLCSPFSGDISGYNLFVKRCIKAFASDGTFLVENFNISQGVLGNYQLASATISSSTDELSLDCSVREDSNYNLSTDELFVIVWNNSQKRGFTAVLPVAASYSSESISLPAGFANSGEQLFTFLATKRIDNSQASDTLFVSTNVS